MQHWQVTHSSDGFAVELVEVPLWALATSHFVDALDGHLGHVLCGQGAPDWAWHVPVGWPVYDPDDEIDGKPWLVNSLASKVGDLWNWAMGTDYRNRREVHRFAVTEEEARLLGWDWFDDEDEITA